MVLFLTEIYTSIKYATGIHSSLEELSPKLLIAYQLCWNILPRNNEWCQELRESNSHSLFNKFQNGSACLHWTLYRPRCLRTFLLYLFHYFYAPVIWRMGMGHKVMHLSACLSTNVHVWVHASVSPVILLSAFHLPLLTL